MSLININYLSHKGLPVPCGAIFKTFPTDRGMCCAFNMQAADKIFRGETYPGLVMSQQSFDKKNRHVINLFNVIFIYTIMQGKAAEWWQLSKPNYVTKISKYVSQKAVFLCASMNFLFKQERNLFYLQQSFMLLNGLNFSHID